MTENSHNITSHLLKILRSNGNKVAIQEKTKTTPRKDLAAGIETLSSNLRFMLNARGTSSENTPNSPPKALMLIKPGTDFFITTYALMHAGIIPIFVDPGLPLRRLKQCFQQFDAEYFVGHPIAFAILKVLGKRPTKEYIGLGKLRRLAREQLTTGKPEVFEGELPAPEETAAILFTSGSTGAPKGVIYTHSMFHANIRFLSRQLRISTDGTERDFTTFPLFLLFAPVLNMQSIIPDMNMKSPAKANIKRLWKCAKDADVTSIFASPELLRKLVDAMETNPSKFSLSALPHLRRIISAGAPANVSVMRRLHNIAKPLVIQIFTPYGATESLPISTIEASEFVARQSNILSGWGNPVGMLEESIQVKIIDPSFHPDMPNLNKEDHQSAIDDVFIKNEMPSGKIGQIWVSSAVTSREYLGRPDANAALKLTVGRENNRTYHATGDLGWKDEQGMLWYLGRVSQQIISTQGIPMQTMAYEPFFNNLTGVKRSALVRISAKNAIKTAIVIQPEKYHGENWAQLLREMKKQQKAIASVPKRFDLGLIDYVVFKKDFPVDPRHNAKIERYELSKWATRNFMSGKQEFLSFSVADL